MVFMFYLEKGRIQGLSEHGFYDDSVYKLKKIVGSNNFSAQFIKIISHYKKIGYNINVLQQTACLVDQPTGVQLKRKAKLPTVIGLTTKHAVCCNTLML